MNKQNDQRKQNKKSIQKKQYMSGLDSRQIEKEWIEMTRVCLKKIVKIVK